MHKKPFDDITLLQNRSKFRSILIGSFFLINPFSNPFCNEVVWSKRRQTSILSSVAHWFGCVKFWNSNIEYLLWFFQVRLPEENSNKHLNSTLHVQIDQLPRNKNEKFVKTFFNIDFPFSKYSDHVEGYGSVCDCDSPAPIDELSSFSSPVLNNQVSTLIIWSTLEIKVGLDLWYKLLSTLIWWSTLCGK